MSLPQMMYFADSDRIMPFPGWFRYFQIQNPLIEPMLAYCLLDLWEQLSL